MTIAPAPASTSLALQRAPGPAPTGARLLHTGTIMLDSTATLSSTLLFPFMPAPANGRARPSLVEMIQLERVVDAVCDAEAVVSVSATAELGAVAEHARAVEPWLRDMANARGVDAASLRRAAPRVFERDTLVLLRQGLAHAEDLRVVAEEDGDVGLAAFCASWLARRRPLVDAVAAALAVHPS